MLIDRQGVLASKSLLWVVPNPDRLIARSLSTMEAIDALFCLCASSLFTAWLDEVSTGRNIRNSDLRDFPVPRSEDSWRLLSSAASTFLARAGQGSLDRNALQALDLTVAQAYGLPANDPVILAAHKRLEGVPDPALDGLPRYLFTPHSIPPPAVEPIECEGYVSEVSESELLLNIEGITPAEGSWVQVPANFPGYLCQPGRRFFVRLGDNDDLFTGDYHLPSGTWASTAELVDFLIERHSMAERPT